MEKAIFLDRDGVIIENLPGYVRSWADVQLLPNALTALARLRHLPYRVVLVTNQSAVGRGILSLAEAVAINDRLLEQVRAAGGRIDGVFLCPHAPEDLCDCRKPKPGLLLQAAAALKIDLPGSLLIGDALSDIDAAYAAGVRTAVLVATGRGAQQAALPEAWQLAPFLQFADLSAVVDALVDGLLSIDTNL